MELLTEEEDSCLGCDSNVLILPASRAGKGKRKAQERETVKDSKLSKARQRKLRKIEEEKERANLLSESIKALEEYKIPENSLSLLRSSRNLSRVETQKEKRRKAVQYSIAGLEIDNDSRSAGVNVCVSEADDRESSEILDDCRSNDFSFSTSIPLLQSPRDGNAGVGPNDTVIDNEVSDKYDIAPMIKCKSSEEYVDKYLDSTSAALSEGVFDTCNKTISTLSSSESHKKMVNLCKPFVVPVSRPHDVENERSDLPIVGMEQEIMEAVNSDDSHVIIICGKTGCGKTTQVPQFLYEAGFGSSQCIARRGMIGITQPRRVAVFTTAKRVACELGFHLGKEVGFQVRYDKKIGENCSIKFMTDGILLREVQSDILMRRYSVIILDEAHERSVNTDILVGMLSRVVKLRQKKFEEQLEQNVNPEDMIFPLKLILMSATLRIEDFSLRRTLFHTIPPVINIEGRQYDVVKHYSKRTETVDYVGEAYKKVLSIHKRLPQGGILVFVTGRREVEYLCSKLKKTSMKMTTKTLEKNESIDEAKMEIIDDSFDRNGNVLNVFDSPDSDGNDSEVSDDFDSESDEDSEVEKNLLEENETFSSLKAAFESLAGTNMSSISSNEVQIREDKLKLHVLPLYAMLPAREQLRVYEQQKEGERLVVVATNVAETSLTIPGIRYVVDTGREKVKKYNRSSGIESYDIQWISKASADQRAGRAGRTGPGHCYRLYSRAVFENIFPQFSCPEISKVPVDSIVLVLKSMGITKVENFPFPTPPESAALLEAESCLKTLEALDNDGRLTNLGKSMAHYPMNPRHSRMILTTIQICRNAKSCSRPNVVIGYAIAASVVLSHPNPFQMKNRRENNDDENSEKYDHDRFSNPNSDALTSAYALQCFEQSTNRKKFCFERGIQLKIMEEMSKLRKQILHIMFHQNLHHDPSFSWIYGTLDDVEREWSVSSEKFPLNLTEESIIRKAICSGWVDKVARKLKVQKKANSVAYEAYNIKEHVFLHRSSSVFKTAPEFLIYSELLFTKRPYMHGATMIRPGWLSKFSTNLLWFSLNEKQKLL